MNFQIFQFQVDDGGNQNFVYYGNFSGSVDDAQTEINSLAIANGMAFTANYVSDDGSTTTVLTNQ